MSLFLVRLLSPSLFHSIIVIITLGGPAAALRQTRHPSSLVIACLQRRPCTAKYVNEARDCNGDRQHPLPPSAPTTSLACRQARRCLLLFAFRCLFSRRTGE